MQAYRVVLILVVAHIFQGCITPARPVGTWVFYPEPANFTLKGKLDAKQLSIATHQVYVQRVEYRREDIVDYYYLRFWPDGRCFLGTGAYKDLDRDAVESIEVGNPGYFIVEGDSITIETFSREFSGSYALSRGKLIKGDDGNINIRILETRYVGGSARFSKSTYRYPYFGTQGHVRFGDFYPVDFGPLRAMPTWGGDLDVAQPSTNAVETGVSK